MGGGQMIKVLESRPNPELPHLRVRFDVVGARGVARAHWISAQTSDGTKLLERVSARAACPAIGYTGCGDWGFPSVAPVRTQQL